MKVYLNGKIVDESEAKISVFDHGLLYGDGVFEGIRLYDKCVFKLDEHLERLEQSAKAILLKTPWSREELSKAVCETCRANDLTSGYIRLVITRGVGSLGLNPYLCNDPQLFIIAGNIKLYSDEDYRNGLKIITVPTRRSNPSALPPSVKSLNYLNNILAKVEAINAGCMEALMLNDQGYIAECTGDNVFIYQKGTLYTPPVYAGALNGITRQVVIEIAKDKNIPIIEREMTRYDIWTAEECFLTGTAAEVIPVTAVDSREIGSGIPGEVTLGLIKSFHNVVNNQGTML